jgi:hypothetical protein
MLAKWDIEGSGDFRDRASPGKFRRKKSPYRSTLPTHHDLQQHLKLSGILLLTMCTDHFGGYGLILSGIMPVANVALVLAHPFDLLEFNLLNSTSNVLNCLLNVSFTCFYSECRHGSPTKILYDGRSSLRPPFELGHLSHFGAQHHPKCYDPRLC